jgi:2,3-bisphosphoglycerate-independent phosphoglycerate mutase
MVKKGADIEGIRLTPPHDHLGEVIEEYLPTGCAVAQELLEMQQAAFRFLNHHPLNEARRAAGKMPANGIWFWAEGTAAILPDFQQKYGHTGEVVSAVPLVQGIARLSGLTAPVVPGVTGDGKCQKTIEILSRCDFAALHIEAPDECTHNGDTPGKLQSIEWLDSRETAPIVEWLRSCGEDFRILLLSDHKTLTSNRAHDGDPVPFLIYDSRETACSGLSYTEKNGLETGVYVPDGSVLLDMLFEQ